MKKAVQRFLYVVIGITLFTGCSPEPSADDGQKAFQDELGYSTSSDRIKLVSFKKVNGQKGQIQNANGMAVQSYSLEYQGEIEAMQRCDLMLDEEHWKLGFWTISETDSTFTIFTNSMLNVGQHCRIYGTVVFEKTDSGWRESKIENHFE